jgi:hypothetical protein
MSGALPEEEVIGAEISVVESEEHLASTREMALSKSSSISASSIMMSAQD